MFRVFLLILVSLALAETGAFAYRQPPTLEEMAYLDQQVAAQPTNSRPLQMRGLNYAVLGQKDKALADFKEAQKLSPNQIRLYWTLGWALFNLDDYPAAVNVWEHAAALAVKRRTQGTDPVLADPDDLTDESWIPSTLALGYWAEGDQAKAFDYFNMVAKVNYRYRDHDLFAQTTNGWTEKEQTMGMLLFDAWKRTVDKPSSHL